MSDFYSAIVALQADSDAQKIIASDAARAVEGYSGYGPTMHKLATEVVSYWVDIAANNGTIEDSRELDSTFDYYAEEPNPSTDEKISLIGELWNHEYLGESDTLEGFIENWCSAVGSAAQYAVINYLENNS